MASNVSRGWLEPELNDMSFGRTHDQATSGGEIHDRDCPWLWSKELSDKRTRTLTSLDQTERIEGLQGRPDRYARYTEKFGEILLTGQRFTRSVAAFRNPVLQDLRRVFESRVLGACTRFDPSLSPASAPLLVGSSERRPRCTRCVGPRPTLGAMGARSDLLRRCTIFGQLLRGLCQQTRW